MDNRTTIKDLAAAAGVSISTVHCALHGKPGVSNETRERIQELAKALSYTPNSAAASLKRKTLHIVASFPDGEDNSRFYYDFVWEGIAEYFKTQRDLNIELIRLPFHSNNCSHAKQLERCIGELEVDGLLTTGETDPAGAAMIRELAERLPVGLVSTDIHDCKRLYCVSPDYFLTGELMGELLARQITPAGSVLISAGRINTYSHYEIVNGLRAYFSRQGLPNRLYLFYPDGVGESAQRALREEILRIPDLQACAAVNTQGSLILGRTIHSMGLDGKIVAVGNDMFDENIAALKDNTLTMLINKKPFTQAYTAAQYLAEYLLFGCKPPFATSFIQSEVIFQSGLQMYVDGYLGRMR